MIASTRMMKCSRTQIRQLLRFTRYNHFTTVTSTNTIRYLGNRRVESFVNVSDEIEKMDMNNIVSLKNKRDLSYSYFSTSNNQNKNPFWKGAQELLSLHSHDDHSYEQYKIALELIETFPEYQSDQVCDWERMYEVLKPSESQYPFVCQLLVYTLAYYYGHTKHQWNSCLQILEQKNMPTQSLAHGWLKLEAKWYSGKFLEIINETGPALLSQLHPSQNDKDNFFQQRACVYNAMAIAHLIINSDTKDTSSSSSTLEEAKEWLSKSESLLSQHSSDVENNAQLAMVKSNLIILHILKQKQEHTSTVDDNSFKVMEHFEEVLNQLSSNDNDNSDNSNKFVKTHILSNMIHYLLHDKNSTGGGKISEKDLKLASQYAKDVLDLASSFENDNFRTKTIMKRALWNIAQCFAKTGASAVTAEGLYKSCLEDYVNNTEDNIIITWQQELLNANIQEEYATFLTKSYDNRSSEANIYFEKSKTLSSKLQSKNIKMEKVLNAWLGFLTLITI